MKWKGGRRGGNIEDRRVGPFMSALGNPKGKREAEAAAAAVDAKRQEVLRYEEYTQDRKDEATGKVYRGLRTQTYEKYTDRALGKRGD